MALNPITYTENIISNFLRYQLTAYPFADERLHAQMRRLLSLEETRNTPLMKGPYVSLSRAFAEGGTVGRMVDERLLHPYMQTLIRHPHLYGHQEEAIRAICEGRPTIVSTGTGSGKTECFLYPIISKCLRLRDEGAPAGVCAVIVYPMNALAEDQLGRLRALLAGTGITFGMYVGHTPESEGEVTGQRLAAGSSNEDYMAAVREVERVGGTQAVHPPEERCSREMMRTPGEQPRILLTNVKQMELLLTRWKDVALFDDARLDFLVFDEAHTFRGAEGAETACLIRRLRSFCGRSIDETTCVATSATISDPKDEGDAAQKFAARFFGVPESEVVVVHEQYEPDVARGDRVATPPPEGDLGALLQETLHALEAGDEAGARIAEICRRLTGRSIAPAHWQEGLFDVLAGTEMVQLLQHWLREPREMPELLQGIGDHLKRELTEEELLTWLALGAAARSGERPLLRPVVHAFVRGVGGAVVTFAPDGGEPVLWLSAEQESQLTTEAEAYSLPIYTCTTCGQHYFEHYLHNFRFTEASPSGGKAVDDRLVWEPLAKDHGGVRTLLLDHLVGAEEDDEPARTAPVWFCRYCGAVHPQSIDRCDGCGRPDSLVRLLAVQQHEKHPGQLTSCLGCRTAGGQRGARYREPIRPVRATTVADVHVLAQEMIRHSERPRLLVFADNRQDAAFQAGWMRDHARRFRLRGLIWEKLSEGPISIGDLVAHLDRVLDDDDELSQALLPEVWDVYRKESAARSHANERRHFLRCQLLLEITMRQQQRLGLEPWGRMRVQYQGLDTEDELVRIWAERLEVTPAELLDGIATLLDMARRRQWLHDSEGQIFGRFWHESDRDVQRGYLPLLQGVPQALKLRRQDGDDKNRVSQWIGGGAGTSAQQTVRAWGLSTEAADTLLEQLWTYLVEKGILTPVVLKGQRGTPLPNCTGAYQVDGDRIVLEPHRGVYKCRQCRRSFARPSVKSLCPGWHCKGTVAPEDEDPEDYNLMMLDGDFQMLRAREHSAQVPTDEREILERMFKSDTDRINTLVCTPTLELGVDIGGLDATLMRNVPPLPANYWQRAGRAGRRHRMAVNVTYARPASHDRFFFEDPMRLLKGIVEPPAFHLSNAIMIRKHTHATVLTALNRLAHSDGELSATELSRLREAVESAFPGTVTTYLFDENGNVRLDAYSVSDLADIIGLHQDRIIEHVRGTFQPGWPAADVDVVADGALSDGITEMSDDLKAVIGILKRRLDWATGQTNRLGEVRRTQGTLGPEDDALFNRCDRLIKRYKGQTQPSRGEQQGYDDVITFSVLAAEGFLPGYGLEIGSIVGTATIPRHFVGPTEYSLGRPPAMALRDYVPGNLIYANGHRFVARYFHLDRESDTGKPLLFRVVPSQEAVSEIGTESDGVEASSLAPSDLQAVPICDVDLAHMSHITDDEDYRFQMQVAVYGQERGRHGAGKAYAWGERDVLFRKGVHLRLVNVGPSSNVDRGELGYPVCLVCGQSCSPFSSEKQREHFVEDHETRCGRKVEPTGFYADVTADALSLPDCADRTEAYSVLEALRVGASAVLDMERDDLEILVVGKPNSETVDAILYDPMPGGSGLLDQLCEKFDEIVKRGLDICRGCEANCMSACVDCLCTFRNAYFHRYLDRHVAAERLESWGFDLEATHPIPARLPAGKPARDEMPVNEAEALLRGMLQRAGFPEGQWQHEIPLGSALGRTRPDCFYEGEDDDDPGVCIYLDGLSEHIHGNPETAERDRHIREELRARGYMVREIAVSDLSDREKMVTHFRWLGRLLLSRADASALKDDTGWFGEGAETERC